MHSFEGCGRQSRIKIAAICLGLILACVKIKELNQLTNLSVLEKNVVTKNIPLEPKIHFVTFGTSRTKYYDNALKLAKEANLTGWFDSVKAYTEKDIPAAAARKYEDILKLPRGGGYWIWRYPLLEKKITEINEGDFILWLDSDFSFRNHTNNNTIFTDNSMLITWENMLREADEGILLFQSSYPEEKWTTEHIFVSFNVSRNDTAIRKSGQTLGGVLLVHKCPDFEDYLALVYSVLNKDPW
eukprot:CAMPEP_0172425126 /NCGR_PEP_ID=MMETSP1064-20121228/30287_1 /TAXON_ID=202472 /ORGANISM="Aulacoseira subarctica , Strain CCAP 1002/5" /LENGTH=241 /DNA_ID=CAMNT_0013167765 /DNA_START=55 /DNA_END=777 /DNA_ORIENTATION=+